MTDNGAMPHRQPRLHHVTCPAQPQAGVDEHRMGVWEWGEEASTSRHVVVCVHGLTRQRRDFDVLAQDLVARAAHPVRVICPDVVGRGRSDRLVNPSNYQIPQYAADMLALMAQLQQQVSYVFCCR